MRKRCSPGAHYSRGEGTRAGNAILQLIISPLQRIKPITGVISGTQRLASLPRLSTTFVLVDHLCDAQKVQKLRDSLLNHLLGSLYTCVTRPRASSTIIENPVHRSVRAATPAGVVRIKAKTEDTRARDPVVKYEKLRLDDSWKTCTKGPESSFNPLARLRSPGRLCGDAVVTL